LGQHYRSDVYPMADKVWCLPYSTCTVATARTPVDEHHSTTTTRNQQNLKVALIPGNGQSLRNPHDRLFALLTISQFCPPGFGIRTKACYGVSEAASESKLVLSLTIMASRSTGNTIKGMRTWIRSSAQADPYCSGCTIPSAK